jgi:hypothetical protein
VAEDPVCHYPGKNPAIALCLVDRVPHEETVKGETMKTDQKSGLWLICLTIIIAIGITTLACCVDSAQEQKGQVTAAGTQQREKPAPVSTATTRITTVSATQKTFQPTSAPVSSTGVIRVDPISDKNTGDTFTLTGTTSLAAGTSILWQIIPDTGTPPTGLNGDSMMSVGGNYQVTKGEGTSNRISLAVDLGRLVPGKYVAIVGKMKGDETSDIVFEIGKDYGYTYFTLK